jgi:hypothetical protein
MEKLTYDQIIPLNRLSGGATGVSRKQTVEVTLTEKCGHSVKRYIYSAREGDYGFTPHRSEALPLSYNDGTLALSWLSKNGHRVWPDLTVRAEIVSC